MITGNLAFTESRYSVIGGIEIEQGNDAVSYAF